MLYHNRYGPRSVKMGFNACAKSVVQDRPVQSAQANQGQLSAQTRFLLRRDFLETKNSIKA